MTAEVFTGITAFLSVMLLVVNLYLALVQKPMNARDENAKHNEKTMNEFLIAYAKEYTELRSSLANMRGEIERLQRCETENSDAFNQLTADVQTCLFQLGALNDRLTDYISRGGK